jgi:hypothetical protein
MRFFHYILLFFMATSFAMQREVTCWEHLRAIVSWRNICNGVAATFISTGSALCADANRRELFEPHSPIAKQEMAIGLVTSFCGIPFLRDEGQHEHFE